MALVFISVYVIAYILKTDFPAGDTGVPEADLDSCDATRLKNPSGARIPLSACTGP